MGLWYTANGLGIALGGLLGYGIGNIKGALPSWKYEFIVMCVSPFCGINADMFSVVHFAQPGASSCISSSLTPPSKHPVFLPASVELPWSD